MSALRRAFSVMGIVTCAASTLLVAACSSKPDPSRVCWLYHPSTTTPQAATSTTMFAWRSKDEAELASMAIYRKDQDSYVAVAKKGQKLGPRTRATVAIDGITVLGVDVAVDGATQRLWVVSSTCQEKDALRLEP